jgi:uncharacterized protein
MTRGYLALWLVTVACSASTPPEPKPDPTAETTTMATTTTTAGATPAPDTTAALAGHVIDWLAAGEHAKVRALFAADMAKAVPDDAALAAMWSGVEGKLGKLERQLAVTESDHDGYHIVDVTCAFGVGVMDLRLVFDGERHVAGFFVRPTTRTDVYGARPQTPKAPFPYEEREVLYDNPADGSKIGGSLTLPPGPGPHPAVLLITGSGAQDRDETIFGHKPFLLIADRLTRQGIAVLRVDDRGIGKTTGSTESATIETHATDAEAGVAFLAAQKEIDKARIGLVGHSEGGIIAAVVASRSKAVAFVVSLAGTGLPGSQINPLQIAAILRAEGSVPPEGIAAIVEEQKKLMKLVADGADQATLMKALEHAVQVAQKWAPDDEKAQIAVSVAAGLTALGSPWFRSFVKLDPAPYWRKVTVPVLAMIGDKDTQVPADENFAAMKAALAQNRDASFEKLAGLNHLFQPAKTGLMAEYSKIETTFDEAALDLLGKWLRKRAKLEP